MSLRTWLSLLGLGVAFWIIVTYSEVLLGIGWVLFGAFLLSLPIRRLATYLAQWRVPRSLTALGAYIVLLGVFVLLGELLVPLIRSEIDSVRSEGPTLLGQVMRQFANTPLAGVSTSLSTLTSGLTSNMDAVLPRVVTTVTGLGDVAIDILVLFVLSYLFAIDEGAGHGWFSRWFSQERRTEIDIVWRRASERLTRWVWAQGAIAVYFAVVFGAGLSLLGVPYALSIGIVGGLLEVVPYLGGITAVVLAAVSALTVSPWTAVWVIIFYLVVAAVESHLIAPYFYGRAIGLRSAWVLIALVLGAKAEGVLGVLFAVPIAVVASAVIQEIWEHNATATVAGEDSSQG